MIKLFSFQVPESATTRDVIRQAVSKAGQEGAEHEYVLLEEVVAPSANGEDFLTTPPTHQRMVGMDECPLFIRNRSERRCIFGQALQAFVFQVEV